MAKVNLTQKILGFDGEPLYSGVDHQAAKVINACHSLVLQDYGKEASDKFSKKLMEINMKELTLKDLIMASMMVTDESSSQEKKIEEYRLLQMIANGDEADLGMTERSMLYRKISETYKHLIIIGRSKEMLIDAFEKESSKTKK